MMLGIEIPNDFVNWLLRTTVQASILITLIVGLQWLFQDRLSPRARFALWWLVILRLVMPVSIESPLSLFNLVPNQPFETQSHRAATWVNTSEVASSPEAIESTESPPPSQERAADSGSVPPPQQRPQGQWSWKVVVFAVWLAGAVFLGTTMIILTFLHHRRIRFLPRLTNQRISALFTECRKRMGINRAIELRQSYEESSPALYGLLSPVLLMPKDLLTQLRSDQLRHVFLHELAHFKRGDIAFNWLTSLLAAVHWFNPFFWWALRRMRTDLEMACDSLTLSFLAEDENQAYGETLLELTSTTQRSVPLPGLVGIVETNKPIKRRIHMIAKFKKTKSHSVLAIATVGVLGLIALTDASTSTVRSSDLDPDSTSAEILDSVDEYDFRLMSVKTKSQIPEEGSSVVILVRINGDMHFRIFDHNGRQLVNVTEKQAQSNRSNMRDLENAIAALGEIGKPAKDAIPLLIEELHSRDVPKGIELSLVNTLPKIAPNSPTVASALAKNLDNSSFPPTVLLFLKEMGRSAQPAVPGIIDYCWQTRSWSDWLGAGKALQKIRPKPGRFAPLLNGKTDFEKNIDRLRALVVVGVAGVEGASIKSTIAECLKDNRQPVIECAGTLAQWNVSQHPPQMEKEIERRLSSETARDARLLTIEMLGDIGLPARKFRASLRKAQDSPHNEVAVAADQALRKIFQARLSEAGIESSDFE